ncbi:MAG TPA: 2-hydroxyacyl-CoA dehydratase family protein [Bryobacteraceae bacterium]|nr:2-hydroxyacyl-CoA dehydratase family protein [Bryobacteraceae bacterium]
MSLTRIYTERAIHSRNGGPVVGVTSNTVPWDLLRAAGLRPVLLSPRRKETPLADRYMEDAFSGRIKAIFDFLISSEGERLAAVVIPRTSEQEHKLYLYLREVARQGLAQTPKPILYNLLHARSPEAEAYGLDRTHDLKQQLEQLTGRPIQPDALREAIAEGNAARQAIRALLQQRAGIAPRLRGSEALALIGAWYFMDRSEYALLAQQALREIETRTALEGPRILIKGSPLDSPALPAAIESHGAVVVAEDDWWGSRSAGRDIDTTMDPLRAIFEKYYFDAPSPRVFPSEISDAWFYSKASEVDGVIFYLPQEDDVLGWDYPRLRDYLGDRAIPYLMVRSDSSDEIGAFIERLRHG